MSLRRMFLLTASLTMCMSHEPIPRYKRRKTAITKTPLTKEQTKQRNKNKRAKQARKLNRENLVIQLTTTKRNKKKENHKSR